MSAVAASENNVDAGAVASPSGPLRPGQAAARGMVWLGMQMLGSKVVIFVGQLALANVLAKADFGLVAEAYTVTAIVNLLANPGVDAILVQRGRRFDLWSGPAVALGLVTGLAGALILVAAAPLAEWIYRMPAIPGLAAADAVARGSAAWASVPLATASAATNAPSPLAEMLWVFALATPLGAIGVVPLAWLRYQLRFRPVAVFALAQATLITVGSVILAYLGAGPFSFVVPIPVAYLVMAIVQWRYARPPVRRRRALRHMRWLVTDSSYLFGTRVLTSVVEQGDYALLAICAGETVVGVYFFAYSLAVQAMRLIGGSMYGVLQPAFSRIESAESQLAAALKSTRVAGLLSLLGCILQALLAAPAMHLLFGNKWDDATYAVQALSVGMGICAVTWTFVPLLIAQGRYRLWFWSMAPVTATFLALAWIGARGGSADSMATSVAVYYVIVTPVWTCLVARPMGFTYRQIAELYGRIVAVGAVPSAVGWAAAAATNRAAAMQGWSATTAAVVTLVAVTISFCAAALAAIRIGAPDVWALIAQSLRALRRRFYFKSSPTIA